MSETPRQTEETQDERRESRRRVVGFVGVFVTVMLILLTAYRYTIPTPLNDWYLFQVARDTSWVLGKVGYRSGLEERPLPDNASQQQVRASLAAWRAGREAATPQEIAAASHSPLSAWERWSYHAREGRKHDEASEKSALENHKRYKRQVSGPQVSFVLRPGFFSEIEELQGRLDGIANDPALDSAGKDRQRAVVQKRLDELDKERSVSTDKTQAFTFIVISECGAIEVMAIFLAAVLAFPAPWWKRVLGLVTGLPLMYGVNIFRLSVLGVIGALDTNGKWFKFAHEYVWQAVYIVFVVAVWLAWVEYIVRREEQ